MRFPLLNYVQVISCATPPICRLKNPFSCFSSHFFLDFDILLFVFKLTLLLLAAAVSISLLFFVSSMSLRIVASTLSSVLASPLSYFLERNSMSLESLLCKAFFYHHLHQFSLSFGPFCRVLSLPILRMVQCIFFEIVARVFQRDILIPYMLIICLDNVIWTLIDRIKENGFTLKRTKTEFDRSCLSWWSNVYYKYTDVCRIPVA